MTLVLFRIIIFIHILIKFLMEKFVHVLGNSGGLFAYACSVLFRLILKSPIKCTYNKIKSSTNRCFDYCSCQRQNLVLSTIKSLIDSSILIALSYLVCIVYHFIICSFWCHKYRRNCLDYSLFLTLQDFNILFRYWPTIFKIGRLVRSYWSYVGAVIIALALQLPSVIKCYICTILFHFLHIIKFISVTNTLKFFVAS